MADCQHLFADLLQAQAAGAAALPPVARWQPRLCGDMDMRIARDGTWYHQGEPIRRAPLVKLFAGLLKREGDDYYLVTPGEKWRIQVEDAPFFVIDVDVHRRDDQQALVFTTLTGDRVVAGADNPLRVSSDPASGEPAPYLRVRGGMEGRLARTVFYHLAALAEEHPRRAGLYGVISLGLFWPLQ